MRARADCRRQAADEKAINIVLSYHQIHRTLLIHGGAFEWMWVEVQFVLLGSAAERGSCEECELLMLLLLLLPPEWFCINFEVSRY